MSNWRRKQITAHGRLLFLQDQFCVEFSREFIALHILARSRRQQKIR